MTDLLVFISLALSMVSFVALVYCLQTTRKLRQRFTSAFANLDSDKDLAETVITYFEKLGITEQKLNHIQKSYKHLSAIGASSLQKIGVVRFNPFRNTGGDQSFVLALLDNNDSGVLLTSIHGREGTRIYIKGVAFGKSEYKLSTEEESALKAAGQHKVKASNGA